jgi:hypothetical protein
VQTFRCLAAELGEARLDGRMDVLGKRLERRRLGWEGARFDLALELLQSLEQELALRFRQEARRRQGLRVGSAALEVLTRQPAIHGERGREPA